MLLTDAAVWGSSPLTRGKPGTRRPCTPSSGAHPRSRGENILHLTKPLRGVGSSPLTRGKLDNFQSKRNLVRLIPAHAGKTIPSRFQRRTQRAHPRSRGENDDSVAEEPELLGSSPLTRGKRITKRWRDAARRLIPAHAGKTRTLQV